MLSSIIFIQLWFAYGAMCMELRIPLISYEFSALYDGSYTHLVSHFPSYAI